MSVVLAVDDEPQLLRTLQITLTARGHDVHTATTGRRAIAEATARPPDLVLLDLGLPDIDGAEVINRLRAQSAVPIIVLSGRTSGGDKVAALDGRRRRLHHQTLRHRGSCSPGSVALVEPGAMAVGPG